MKTTACVLLLAAAAWGQQVAVPAGGALGASSSLSDAATLNADKLDGSHCSLAPGANSVPVSDSEGKIAAGWIPLPTSSSIGGVLMDSDCLAGNHVNGIDAASGRLKCSADTGGDWSTLANKPADFPPSAHGHGESEITDLQAHLAEKAPVANPTFTGTVNASEVVAASNLRVGSEAAQVNFSYGTDGPLGACTAGVYWQQVNASTVAEFYCNGGVWSASGTGSGGLGGTVTPGKILLAATSSTAGDSSLTENSGDITSTKDVKAPVFQGTATSDQGIDIPPAVSPTVSATGHVKLISQSNKLMASLNGGAFAEVAANAPPGADTEVPFNDNGAWGYGADMTFNKATKELAVGGPVTAGGTSQMGNITETTPTNAATGKGKVMFNSSTHRPCYGYDGSTLPCSDVVVQADVSATSAADKIVKLDGSGLLDPAMLPVPSATTLGGVKSKAAESGKFLTAIGTDGAVSSATIGVPTRSVLGGVYISAACGAGYHVSDINQTTGELSCSADATVGGTAAPVGFITGMCGANQTASATNTLLGLGSTAPSCVTTYAANLGWTSTAARTLKNLHISMGVSKTGNSYTFTVWQLPCTTVSGGACTAWGSNGATTMTCTASGATGGVATCSDSAHDISVAEFDIISLKWGTVASDNAGGVQAAIEVW